MKLKVANALANYVKNINEENIIPSALDRKIPDVIAKSIK
jgi:hypothetical protein